MVAAEIGAEGIVLNEKDYTKYKNPDPRCTFPFGNSAFGYCWAYANHVDGTLGLEDMEKLCSDGTCEFWDETRKESDMERDDIKDVKAELQRRHRINHDMLIALERLEAENKLLREKLDKHRWIPVSERLPELCLPYPISKDILLYDGEVSNGYYCKGEGWVIYGSHQRANEYQKDVTHWKPIILPEQALR